MKTHLGKFTAALEQARDAAKPAPLDVEWQKRVADALTVLECARHVWSKKVDGRLIPNRGAGF